jgi:hypothetical protein
MSDNSEQLLRAILATVGRQVFPPERLGEIVVSKAGSDKQLAAYNMCDGLRNQSEIAKSLKLDSGNFSRTIGRWVEAGILFRIGEGRDARLLHIYPLSSVHNGATRSRR